MPEGSEAKAVKRRVQKTLEYLKDTHGNCVNGAWLSCFGSLALTESAGRLMIHPSTWAVGTKEKDYTTLTVDRSAYNPSLEPADPSFLASVDPFDRKKLQSSKYTSCQYLLNRLSAGPVSIEVRGKLLAITLGYVSSNTTTLSILRTYHFAASTRRSLGPRRTSN